MKKLMSVCIVMLMLTSMSYGALINGGFETDVVVQNGEVIPPGPVTGWIEYSGRGIAPIKKYSLDDTVLDGATKRIYYLIIKSDTNM